MIKTLVVHGSAISTNKLHQIKFAEIVNPYREAGAVSKPGTVGFRDIGTRFSLVAAPLPSPKGWPSGHYERLAEDYRTALVKSPTSPTRFLIKKYGVSAALMREWLRYAHNNGLLPERSSKAARPKNPREDT